MKFLILYFHWDDTPLQEHRVIWVGDLPAGSVVPVWSASRQQFGYYRDYRVALLYQRKTRSARSVFHRLALPTLVSISNGIYSG